MKIFVLEDDVNRISWFKKTFNDAKIDVVNKVSEASRNLRKNKYDLIFLDHDLETDNRTGEDIAWEMNRDKLAQDTPVIIHTINKDGSEKIKKYLDKYHKKVYLISFLDLKEKHRIDFKEYLNS